MHPPPPTATLASNTPPDPTTAAPPRARPAASKQRPGTRAPGRRAPVGVRLIVAILSALACAAAPAAAAPWSAPTTIPGATGAPAIANGPSGPRALYWSSVVPPNPGGPRSFVSPLGPGLRPEPARPLPAAFQLGTVGGVSAVDGRGRIVLPALMRTRPNKGALAAGPLSAPRLRTLPAPVRATAVNAAGDAAVVIEPWAARGYRPAAPRLVLRRHGHGFGRPLTLDRTGHGVGAAVAIDRRGRVLAAWDRDGRAYGRFVTAHGTLGAIQRLGPAGRNTAIQAVLSDDGRAAVAWTAQRVSEGYAASPFTARLALATANRRFAPPTTLETVRETGFGRYVPAPGVVVRLPAGRPGLAAWTGHDGQHWVVRAASIHGTTLTAPQIVSEPGTDTVLGDAAAGPRGEAVVLLLPGCAPLCPAPSGPGAGLAAATRAASAPAFGAPEPIVPAPAAITGAQVAIQAATGLAFATWADDHASIGWSVRAPIH